MESLTSLKQLTLSSSLSSSSVKKLPKNKHRRSFTPCNLNQTLPSPEVSPIANNNNRSLKSIKYYDSVNNDIDNVYKFLENSFYSSPLYLDDNNNNSIKDSSSSHCLMLPPKKTVIRRISGCGKKNLFESIACSNNEKYMKTSLKFSASTPVVKTVADSSSSSSINHSDEIDCNRSENIDNDDTSFDDDISGCGNSLNNQSNISNSLNYIDLNNNNISDDLVNLTDSIILTPKTSLNKCLTVSSILIGINLAKYIKNFQKKNLNVQEFMNLNNSELIKQYGITNDSDRNNILKFINSEME